MCSSAGDTATNQGKNKMTKQQKRKEFIIQCFEKTGVYNANSAENLKVAHETLRDAGFGFEIVNMSEDCGHFLYRLNDTDRNGYTFRQL